MSAVAYHYISGNAPVPGKTTIRRQNVLCILKHRSQDSYGILLWTTLDRKSFVMGGVDEDTLEAAGMREISEETGYTDIKYIQTMEHEVHAEYFAAHKDINRYSIEKCAVYQLLSDDQHDKPLDDANHNFVRVPYKEVEGMLTDVPGLSSNVVFWLEYTGQEEKLQTYLEQFSQVEKA